MIIKNNNTKVFCFFLIVLLVIIQLNGQSEKNKSSHNNAITFNLTDIDFKSADKVPLKVESLFYWKQWPLDSSFNFNEHLLKDSDTMSWPPALWTQKDYESQGFGTYAFTIERKDTITPLILELKRGLGALEVWTNSERIYSHGKISKTIDGEVCDGRPLRIDLPGQQRTTLFFLVSNHNSRLGGGFPLANTIIKKEYFEKVNKTKPILEAVLTILILLFGVYQVIRYFHLKKYPYFLYLGLFCLFGGSRQLFVGESLIYSFIPDISFAIVQKMRYIGYYGGLLFVFLYHHKLYPNYFSKLYEKTMVSIIVAGILYVVFASVYHTTFSAPIFQVLGLVIILSGFYQMIRAVRDKRPYAYGMLISMSLMSIILINDLLNAMSLLETDYFANVGLLFYIIYQIAITNLVQHQTEKKMSTLFSEISDLSTKIRSKEEEVSHLRIESFQQLKSKEKLVENLKKVDTNNSSFTIPALIANLKSELLEDAQLRLIKNDLEAYNHEFIRRLKTLHPNLTLTDLEICSYLRMSLGRKEIARLRFTSVDAVKKTRNRLRKKLGISSEVDLVDYLKSI